MKLPIFQSVAQKEADVSTADEVLASAKRLGAAREKMLLAESAYVRANQELQRCQEELHRAGVEYGDARSDHLDIVGQFKPEALRSAPPPVEAPTIEVFAAPPEVAKKPRR